MTQPEGSFLQPKRPRRTLEEKRAAARDRQKRHLNKLYLNGDAPATVIGNALLAALATAENLDASMDSPIVESAMEKLVDAGYCIPLIYRRIRAIREKLKHEQPGDAADRKRRAAR